MNKIAIASLVVGLLCASIYWSGSSNRVDQAFQNWKGKFQAKWGVSEQAYRRIIFERNLLEIERHNADPTATYKKGINQFTVYSDEQFVKMFLMQVPASKVEVKTEIAEDAEEVEGRRLQTVNINWVTQGKVSPVDNQGRCGGCYAFSVTGALESLNLINTNNLIDLSQQQILDCSSQYGNNGCSGGMPEKAMFYVLDNGLTTSQSYPFKEASGTCQVNGGSFRISSVGVAQTCGLLQLALQRSPVSIVVNAQNWNSYSSGVFGDCQSTPIDHAVLLVGMTNTYWYVKNSWGTTWGENGYIRLSPGNTCGLCNHLATYAS